MYLSIHRLITILAWGSIGLALMACSTRVPAKPPEAPGGEIGLASYYSDRFHGRPTASGEPYDRLAFTAAHRRLPFGTRVVVTRLDNGLSVTVRINDRGPFVSGRVIDLSYAAARRLDMLAQGVVKVSVVRGD